MNDTQALQVLFAVRAACGRNYKSAIRLAWSNGDYDAAGLGQWAGRLQQIRNQFGPSWLEDVRPKHLAWAQAKGITFTDLHNLNTTKL